MDGAISSMLVVMARTPSFNETRPPTRTQVAQKRTTTEVGADLKTLSAFALCLLRSRGAEPSGIPSRRPGPLRRAHWWESRILHRGPRRPAAPGDRGATCG